MTDQDHPDRLSAMALSGLICFPMALRAAIELKVFEIIANAGQEAQLSPWEMVAKMPATNPHAATALERILRILVANSMLTMSMSYSSGEDGKLHRVYGLTNHSPCLVPGEDGLSLASLVQLRLHSATTTAFYHLGDAVLDGCSTPFERAHGRGLFEFAAKGRGYNKVFHEAMSNIAAIVLNEVLQVYKGFDGVKEMVDWVVELRLALA